MYLSILFSKFILDNCKCGPIRVGEGAGERLGRCWGGCMLAQGGGCVEQGPSIHFTLSFLPMRVKLSWVSEAEFLTIGGRCPGSCGVERPET